MVGGSIDRLKNKERHFGELLKKDVPGVNGYEVLVFC